MRVHDKAIDSLVDCVKIDESYISCHFKCRVKDKTVISTVAFEPYDGKIEFTWKDIVFHPFKSYNRYYHTPIVIYGKSTEKTIVRKAFKNVANYFIWSQKESRYIYN